MGVFRVVVALMLYASGIAVPLGHPVAPLWVYALLSSTFTFAGLALVLSQRQDHRAEWLGGLLVMVGCPLVRPLIAGAGAPPLAWLESFHPEVFAPAFAWCFAASFPTPLSGRSARVVRGVSSACVAIGFVLVGFGLMSEWGTGAVRDAANALNRVPRDRVSPIWLVYVALSTPALVVLLWRSVAAPRPERSRAAPFMAAFLVGLGPITLELLAEGIWPTYGRAMHRPATEPWITSIVFVAMGTLPFTMGYAVLFDRVVETRIALQAAAQYVLARYIVGLLTLIPVGGLVLYLVRHREDSLVSLFSGGDRPRVLLASVVAGAAAMRFRPRLVRALDRRYHREPYDGTHVLGQLTGPGGPSTIDELGIRVREEVGKAFHAPIEVFLLHDDHAVLQAAGSTLPPLPVFSALLRLGEDGGPTIDMLTDAGRSLLASLPADEHQWLVGGDIRLVACIRSRALGPIGIIGIGPKSSGLPYKVDDREFLSAVASAVGLTFDSLRLRRSQAPATTEPAARECDGCGSVYPSEMERCRCGRPLADSDVPYVLRGVFRFERRIGSGGSGIVYRAVDLGLGRTVAIKVLSGAQAGHVDAVVREARHMAGVSHRHLAVIHGVERWRQKPLLVQEYLEGGTLAQRMLRGALGRSDVVELGTVLVDVLERLHRDGIVHCDVKPSNIGYTAEGAIKLFDFSVARHVAVALTHANQGALPDDQWPLDSVSRIGGTPFYMSPEAIRGAPPDPRFDWWGLSVVLFEALTGRRPFDGADTADLLASILVRPARSVRELRPDLPKEISDFFVAAFDRTSKTRPTDSAPFRAAVECLRNMPE
jgi:hypothetical protein